MDKREKRIQERILKQQEKVLQSLCESGNVSFACKKAGLSRETYYRWVKEDEDFAVQADKAISDGKSYVNDLAHNQLMRSISEGYFPAIKFQLSNCHDDYHPKKTTSPYRLEEMTPPITIASIPTIARLERYREFIENGGHPDDWER
ncbi:MAG: hypothetical protein H6779_02390 [Candidatus Nomurabacteria bacterium]|nr:MAG: hypothetical protein H6779_02390 [Candidatus Nomurabacteria bacterium]